MNRKKRNILIGIIIFIIILFFSPIFYFKSKTDLTTQNKIDNTNIDGSRTNTVTETKGISINEKVKDLENDPRIKVVNSSVLNFGIYTILKKELILNRIVDNQKIETIVNAECDVWGLGKLSIKKNSFNKILEKRIDEIFEKN